MLNRNILSVFLIFMILLISVGAVVAQENTTVDCDDSSVLTSNEYLEKTAIMK